MPQLHDPADYVDEHLVGLALLDLDWLDAARVLIDSDPVVETKDARSWARAVFAIGRLS
jgi:hypothetical protein